MRTLRKVFEKERERDAHFLLHTATIAIDAHIVRLKMAFDFFFLSFILLLCARSFVRLLFLMLCLCYLLIRLHCWHNNSSS